MQKPHWILKSLLIVFTLATLFDLGMTVYDLSLYDFSFEANPLVHGVITALAVKLIGLIVAWLMYSQYVKSDWNKKFNIVTFFMIGIIAQTYGGYSHINMVEQYHSATEITKTATGYILKNPNETITINNLPEQQRDWYYFLTIFWLVIYPTTFSMTNNYLTKKMEGT